MNRSTLYLVSAAAAAMLSVVDELAADPAQLLRPEAEADEEIERSMVSRSRLVVRVFLYLLSQYNQSPAM